MSVAGCRMTSMVDTPSALMPFQDEVREFAVERDWTQFHDPKSLILALVGEVGELAELFQWIPAEEAADLFGSGVKQQRAAEEISDILIYLLGLGNALGIDVLEAARDKLDAARMRFPTQTVTGAAPEKA